MTPRILHLNTERSWRGGERQTLWLAQELSRRGIESFIAARANAPLAWAAKEMGLPVMTLRPISEFDLLAAGRLRGFIRKNEINLLHAHTAHAVGLGALTIWQSRTRFVATRRVDIPLKERLLTRWKYKRIHAMAAISHRVRDMVLEAGIPPEKITLIPSGIDSMGYPKPADRERLRRERGYGSGEILVVHAAALVAHKDQATLLRAAALVRRQLPARFLILGDGLLRPGLERLAGELELGTGVEFLGHRPDVLEYMAMADLFAFSSAEEGLGTVLLDAMALEVPTAATSAGGIPDIYGPNAVELSPPGDPGLLAENMLRVLKDPQESIRRVERGRHLVKKFSVAAMTDAYELLYRKVLRH